MKKTHNFVRRKVGRPPAPQETVQVGLRLPKSWVDQFRRKGNLSREIQERLARSFFDDATDPRLIELWGQIEQLAVGVRRTFGAEWYQDRKAHLTFVDAVNRLLANLPVPTKENSTLKIDARTAGEVIYNQYLATVRDMKEGRAELRSTARQKLEGSK